MKQNAFCVMSQKLIMEKLQITGVPNGAQFSHFAQLPASIVPHSRTSSHNYPSFTPNRTERHLPVVATPTYNSCNIPLPSLPDKQLFAASPNGPAWAEQSGPPVELEPAHSAPYFAPPNVVLRHMDPFVRPRKRDIHPA